MIYTPAQACEILDCSTSTLRNYCKEAAAYLSDKAAPGANKHRAYTEEDIRVLLVVKLARDYDDAKERLQKGERVDIPTGANDYYLSLESRDKVILLENRIRQLEGQVVELTGERDKRLLAEGRIVELKEQLKEARDEVKQLELKLKFAGED